MKYRVLCEVSGGVTGHRTAYLKNDGEDWIFDDFDSADAMASYLMRQANGPTATAKFSYIPEEIS